jgi:hypothetical protein
MRERKQGEKLRGRKERGSEEDDRGRRESYIFVISLRTTEHNLTNLTLRVFTMR